MDWKEYYEMPDEGMFEKIQGRLRRRRLMRAGAVVASALLVCGVAVWAVALSQGANGDTMMAAQENPAGKVPTLQEVLAPVIQSAETQQPEAVKNEAMNAERAVLADYAERQESVRSVPETYGRTLADTFIAASPVVAPVEAARPLVEQLPEVHRAAPVPGNALVAEEPAVAESSAVTAQSAKPGPVQTDSTDLIAWVPIIIVPSGDEEKNRTFRIVFSTPVNDFHLYIYNRNGRLLHTSTDQMEEWDATYRGSQVPQGAYVWVATFRDAEHRPHHSKGTVTVVR